MQGEEAEGESTAAETREGCSPKRVIIVREKEGWLNYGPQMQKDIETKITLWKYLATAVTFKLNTVNSKHWEMNGL